MKKRLRFVGWLAGTGLAFGFIAKALYVAKFQCPIGAEGSFGWLILHLMIAIALIAAGRIGADIVFRTNDRLQAYVSLIPWNKAVLLAIAAFPVLAILGSFVFWGRCRWVTFAELMNVTKISFSNYNTHTFVEISDPSEISKVVDFLNRKRTKWISPTPEFATPASLTIFQQDGNPAAKLRLGDGGLVRDGALLMTSDDGEAARKICAFLGMPLSEAQTGNRCTN